MSDVKTTIVNLTMGAALCLAGTAAAAHPYLVGPAMEPGQHFKGELQITHNCFGQPSVKVVIRLPDASAHIEGFAAGAWAASVDAQKHEVTWQGKPIEGHVILPFAFDVPALPQGQHVFFPVVQHCTGGETHRWVEVPAKGQSHDDLSYPAAEAVIGEKLDLPVGEMEDMHHNMSASHDHDGH